MFKLTEIKPDLFQLHDDSGSGTVSTIYDRENLLELYVRLYEYFLEGKLDA